MASISMRASARLALFLGVTLSAAFAKADTMTATRITSENVAQLQKQGPDAIGGVDDWHMSNGTLCAVISDPTHEHQFSNRGAALVDLGFCGRADDHYNFNQDLLAASRYKPLIGQDVQARVEDGQAVIETLHSAAGAVMRTQYRLNAEEPTRLAISKTLTVVDAAAADFNLLSLGNFNYHSMEPFVLSSKTPHESAGYSNIDFVSRGTSAITEAAHNADTIITTSPPEAKNPIAYAWRLKSAVRIENDEQTTLPQFALADEESLAMLVMADDFWIGDGSSLGWLQLPQILMLGVEDGVEFQFEEEIWVGDEAGVAAVSDQIFAEHAAISGSADPGTAVHLLNMEGGGISHDRVGKDGRFSFNAPPGEYRLKHLGDADRRTLQDDSITHGTSPTDLGHLQLPNAAVLELPQGRAMRLVFRGLNGTPSPNFYDRLTDFQVSEDDEVYKIDRLAQLFLAGVESDPHQVAIPAGEYQVLATRGLEYSVEETQIKLQAGETLALSIRQPEREIETPKHIAADFHVHAGDSFDNAYSNEERVRTFVAEAGEIMVNTEHDVVVDFAPLVQAMGVEDKITALTGTELTSIFLSDTMPYTGGHANFFPIQPQAEQYSKGVVAHEDRRWREVIHDVRQANPGSIAQLNHPRKNLSLSNGAPEDYLDLIDAGAFFDHMGVAAYPYDPSKPLVSNPNNTLIEADPVTGLRDIDFDAVELVNPGGEYHQDRIEAVRRDWMSLLLQGEHITGTANSDSHVSTEQVAVPRNMVAVDNDHVNDFSRTQFLNSIRVGNLYGTTGPMFELALGDTAMGETFSGNSAELSLNIFAASWIPMQRASIEINGVTVQEVDLNEKLQWQLPMEFVQDSLLTIQIFGAADERYGALYPGLDPYAYSNPIYIDADGDGKWTPPGLPGD